MQDINYIDFRNKNWKFSSQKAIFTIELLYF